MSELVKKQEELSHLVEQQMAKIRQLVVVRQQFMALTADINAFIAKHSDVVRDIEGSGKSIDEKIAKYDEVSQHTGCLKTPYSLFLDQAMTFHILFFLFF
jgi:nesprin-1